MKKLLPILFVLIITSCSKEVPSDQLVERDGLYYEVNSQKPFSGSSVNYFDNGTLENKLNFKDGKLDGLIESYFENGQLNLKGNYINGLEDKLFLSYFDNGQLESKRNWKDGKKEGVFE